jgi:predicted PurR-regulated permease PerM
MKKLFGEFPARLVGIAVVLIAIVFLIFTVQILLVPFVGALFLAYLFEPGVVVLQRRGVGRRNAFILLLVVAAVALLALLMVAPNWLAPESSNGFSADLPSIVSA